MMSKYKQSGFTLIELMIVIAIIGILVTVALPAYSTYTKKSKFAEVVIAAADIKNLMDVCYQVKGGFAQCDSLAKIGGVESKFIVGVNVASATVSALGAVTVTGEATVDNATYILSPTAHSSGSLKWSPSGSCQTLSLC